MAEPFKIMPVPTFGFMDKINKHNRGATAFAQINNVLAEASDVMLASQERIDAILSEHKISTATIAANLEELYSQYLGCCLSDKRISDNEIASLKHLKRLFGLSDATFKQIYEHQVKAAYRESIASVIQDGKVDEGEKEFLKRVERELRIPDAIAQTLYKAEVTAMVQRAFDSALEDNSLSPDEERELNALADSLDVKLALDEMSRSELEKARLYWRLTFGELAPIETSINLQRGELCYYKAGANWHELRTVTQRTNYSGPSARVRIMKGVYWRAGSFAAQRVTQDVMTFIDTGYVYLTNKRVIFMGAKGNKTMTLASVLNLVPFANGVELDKATGKSPFLELNPPVDVFAMVLQRLLFESSR